MKITFTLAFNILAGFLCQSQTISPVQWESKVTEISSTEYDIIINGTIEDGWHLFSQFTHEDGSLPSELTFEKVGTDYELVGTTKESKTVKVYNDIFEVEETYFLDKVAFVQRIRLLKQDVSRLKIILNYQTCREVCINKEEQFDIALDGSQLEAEAVAIDDRSELLANSLKLDLKNKELLSLSEVATNREAGFWKIFVLGFLGGLVALLTPCVFPMIPLTVSYFTKQSQNKAKGISNAVLYSSFIILIYAALSVPFHFLDSVNPEILNTISTNVWLNVIFFIIFIVFAFSFFGYFELTLPHSWSNKMDSASGVGGLIGIFFMAFTLALVSFSCTGPILGSLLAGSLTADGGAIQLTAGMVGFGTALALPFGLFALFPNLLQSLPKSGGWLTTVKVILGFAELALAFKFLSNADLVSHWGILKREVFIGIWIVIFVLLALYFFGVIRFPHDGKKKLTLPRIATGIFVGSFVIYLISGLQKNAPLTLLSGFPPPSFYSVYEQESECPLGLNCFKDFDEGVSAAKAQNKPILLDFTGWACVNCRKMEENVWSDPKVYKILYDDFVLISLYIDDQKTLNPKKQFDFKVNENQVKAIKTVGNKWATFQNLNFETASQPYYVTMSADLEVLNTPIQYSNRQEYFEWLTKSLDGFAN